MVSVEGEVKVLDFGTARATFEGRQAHTQATRLGSLKYMSPERRDGERGDHRSDIFALGLSLIEWLGGSFLPILPLRPGEHDQAIAEAIAAIRDTGLGRGEWDQAARTLLAELCAYEEADRPDAQAAAKVLAAFEDESDGVGLERLAEAHVEPAIAARRLESAGELEGQRINLSLTTSSDRPAGSAREAVKSDMLDEPTWRTEAPAPMGWEDSAEQTIQDARVYQALAPPPYNPPAPGPRPPVAAPPAAAPEPPPGRGVLPMVIAGLGGALVVLVVLGIALGLAMRDQGESTVSTPTSPPPGVPAAVEPAPSPETAEAPSGTGPEADGVAFAVRLEARRFQWVKVLDPDGRTLAKGDRSGLETTLPPGRYRLSVKRVGQQGAQAAFDVDEAAQTWRCEAADGGGTRCFDDLGEEDDPPVLRIAP